MSNKKSENDLLHFFVQMAAENILKTLEKKCEILYR